MELSSKIEKIYDWFSGFHSDPIAKALEVFSDPDTGEVVWTSQYGTLLLVTAVISLIVAFAFYIWPIDHPRFKSWWSWLIMLFVNSGLCLLAGWQIARIRMKLALDHEESWEWLNASSERSFDCFGMGLSNMMVGVLVFCLFSLVLTFFSTNAKYSPFQK